MYKRQILSKDVFAHISALPKIYKDGKNVLSGPLLGDLVTAATDASTSFNMATLFNALGGVLDSNMKAIDWAAAPIKASAQVTVFMTSSFWKGTMDLLTCVDGSGGGGGISTGAT